MRFFRWCVLTFLKRKENAQMNPKTRRLTESALLIALGTVLALLTNYLPFLNLPYGGSITIFSMVPLIILAFRYGIRWGFFSGIVFGVLQMAIGATTGVFAGAELYVVVFSILLDYLAAYAVIGLAPMFKNRISNPFLAVGVGTFVVCLLRYVVHVLSGAILFGSYAEWYFTEGGFPTDMGASILSSFSGTALSWVYSVIYNAMYMVPETIITVVGAVLIMAVPAIRNKAFDKAV
ncbi:MAG: energy-coupled thiamine transporter ThiT [Clostridiales bacterium]|nr:MAG: energy-coupled thiamine transporter ThiT [Clostridiales bacterium]